MNYNLIANCEMLIVVAIYVAILFGFNVRYWRNRMINILSLIYILLFCGSLLELVAFLTDGHANLIWLNYMSNILYMACFGTIAELTMEFCNRNAPVKFWRSEGVRILWMIPYVIEMVALFTTPFTHLLYYVDEAGVYHRGSAFFIQFIPFFYLFITMVAGILSFKQAETLKERNSYLALAFFAVPPFFLGGLQILIPWNQLDLLAFSVAMSVFLNYAVSQNNRITRDPLTRLPNREVMDIVMVEKMKEDAKEDRSDKLHFYLMAGDLDRFKSINDNFGHVEGDKALIATADVLYKVAKEHQATAARYGGDEFVIMLEAEDESLANAMIAEVNQNLSQISKDYLMKLR